MSASSTANSTSGKKRDPDFINAEAAMQRAARKAREKAKRVGSGVVILKEGRIVEESSDTP